MRGSTQSSVVDEVPTQGKFIKMKEYERVCEENKLLTEESEVLGTQIEELLLENKRTKAHNAMMLSENQGDMEIINQQLEVKL